MSLLRILEALFPSSCCACRAPGEAFCAGCRPAPGEAHSFGLAELRCHAAGTYERGLRLAILACKRGRRDVAAALGRLLVERAPGAFSSTVAALVPVPTTGLRRAERGFDQGVLLALEASRASGIPVLSVLRQTAGDAQRGRSRAARLQARERFACEGASLLHGVAVLLVDDVATTGATLRDCARVLAQTGAEVRGAAVVARAAFGAGVPNARRFQGEGDLERHCTGGERRD